MLLHSVNSFNQLENMTSVASAIAFLDSETAQNKV